VPERDFGRVADAVELRLGGKQPAHGDTVKAAGQLTALIPDLDGVGVAETMQPDVGTPDLGVDPAMRPTGISTSIDDVRERRINARLEMVAGAAQRPGRDESIRRQNTAMHR